MKKATIICVRQTLFYICCIIVLLSSGCRDKDSTALDVTPVSSSTYENGRLGDVFPFEMGMHYASTILNKDHFIIAYADNSGSIKAKVGLVEGDDIQFGNPTEFYKDENGSLNFNVFTLLTLDDNRFLVIYRAETDELRVNIGERNGLDIRFLYTPHYNAPVFDNNSAENLSAVSIDPNRFVMSYSAIDSETSRKLGYVQTGVIEKGTITRKEKKMISTGQVSKTSITKKSENEFIVAMSEFQNDYYLSTSYLKIENDRIDILQQATIPSGDIKELSINMMEGNKFAMGFISNKAAIVVGQVYRNTLRLGEIFHFEIGSNSKIFVDAASSRELAFVYKSPDNPDQSYLQMGGVSSNKIKLGDRLSLDSKGTYSYTLNHLNDQRMLLLYGDSGRGMARIAVLPAAPKPGDVFPESTNNLITAPMSRNQFIVGFIESATGNASAAIGTFRGGQIVIDADVHTFYKKEEGRKPARDLTVANIGADKFVMAYEVGWNGFVSVGELIDNTLVFGEPQEIPDVGTEKLSVCNLGNENIALIFGNEEDEVGEVLISKVKDKTIQFGHRYLIDPQGIESYLDSEALEGNRFVISYKNLDDHYLTRGLKYEGEDLTISNPIRVQPYGDVQLLKLNAESFVLAYRHEIKRTGTAVKGVFNASFSLGSELAQFCERDMEDFSVAKGDNNTLIFTYAKGKEEFEPTSAFSRSAILKGENFTFFQEAQFSDKETEFVNAMYLKNGFFVNSYTQGTNASKATTRLGEIESDGNISWD